MRTNRSGFTMVELVMVIVVIGILAGVAVPKFTGVKDQAIKATDLSTASAVMTALTNIKSAWGMSEDDFDWNNDGVEDNIASDLTSQGYPKVAKLKRNGDDLGALIKTSTKSGFNLEASHDLANISYGLYTSKSTNPTRGIKIPKNEPSRDIEGKPDRNDFWIYVPKTDGICTIKGDRIKERNVTAGDFVLIDVNQTQPFNFSDTDGSNSNFSVTCS